MTGGPEFTVSAPDLRQLYVDLKGVEGNLRVELRRGIKEAAQGVADAVKAETSWSSRIPAAVRVKPSFSARVTGVTVEVDGKKAPEARPINNKGKSGTFRHRVFGRDVWVNQPARPFFDAAIRGKTPDIERRIAQVANDVARKAGFH
ncbi:MAG: hypothetical protein ACXVXO_00310 [Mycobacteriaceae bacterium]